MVLLAEFSTSPSSSGIGGCFDGGTVGVEPAIVVTTGVVTGAVVAPVSEGSVVGLGASVGLVTGACMKKGRRLFKKENRKTVEGCANDNS